MEPVRRGWRRELPFLIACVLACSLLAGPWVEFFGLPCGSDWEVYLDNAAWLWHPEWADVGYTNWRRPLHGWLVGGLGEHWS